MGLTVNVHFMVTNYEVGLLNSLMLESKEKSNKSIELATQSTVKLREVLKEILLSDKSITDYRQMEAIGSFFIEIRTILFDFCMSPFLKVLDNEVLNKFEMVYSYLIKFVDSEQVELKKAGKIWQFVNSKFQKELEKKTFPLLLEYRMFEAGISAGNLLADIAQLLAGIILFLWGAGKIMVKGGKLALLKLLKLSATDKVKALALLSAVSLDLGYLKKLQPLTMDSPVFSLVLKNDEINKISTTLINELSYAESRNVKMIDADVANSLLQEYRKPLLFESSATGGDPTYLISILGLFLMLRKRKKEEALENYRLNNIRNLFQEAFTVKLTVSLSKNVKFESFLREVATVDGINIPDNLSVEKILQLIINDFVKQFEKFVESKIKKGVVFSKKGIYSNFNSFINGKFREVSKRKTFDGFVLLIDKRLDSLLLNILNRNALTLSKIKPIKVSELFEMTIGEFYKRFYPEKKMSEMYGRFVDKIKRNGGKEIYDKREKLLAVINSGTSKNVDSLLKDYEALTDEINFLIQELIDKKKISITDSDKIVLRVFGKLNIDGKCGAARPDMALMSLIEGTNVFDFLHAANKDVVDPSHLTGSDFYQDFFRVIFGEIPKENEVTKDIIYTFSEEFMKKLK